MAQKDNKELKDENAFIPNNTSNVTSGKGNPTGYLFYAAAGTTLPTDATTALADTYKNGGYIDESGITESVSTDSEDKKDMNGDNILTSITSNKLTWQFKLVELRTDVLKLIYGDANVTAPTTSADGSVKDKAIDYTNKVLVRDHVLSNGKRCRIIAPLAKITELGDRQWNSGELVGFETTWTLSKDANGVRAYMYIEKDPTVYKLTD